MHRLLQRIFAFALIAACQHSSTSDLASLPMSNDVTVGDGPGIGPELLAGDATLSGATVTLAAGATATLRWSALAQSLVTITSISAPGAEQSSTLVDGTLLLTLHNAGATTAQITPVLSFAAPPALPAWSAKTAP